MQSRFNTRQRNYIILGLCGVLLIMAVGYAAFRTQLNIKGTSNITSEWEVLITNIQSQVINGTPTDAETPNHTETTANFSTNLYSPGDKMRYTVTVENRGSIDAVLKTIEKTDSSNEAIIFTINGIEQGDTLKAKGTTTFTVDVEYNSEVQIQPSNLTSNLEITLNYVQAGTTDEGEVLPAETNLMRSYTENSQLDYHNDEYREKITSIEILNNKNIPSDAVQSWDVSERQNGSVMAWIVNDPENAGFYKLYIGGDGGVVANPNSSYLFALFRQAKIIDLTNLDTSHVTNMERMFAGCNNLENIVFDNNFDTSKVNNMVRMFNNCYELTNLDLSNFNTSKVTNMDAMFAGDRNLISVKFGQNFDTSNVTNMNSMFESCESLTELDISKFNTSNVINMSRMFINCRSLTKLDLSNFDTSNVTNMSSMFAGCNFTSLDLSNFDTNNVTTMNWMFSSASNLQTIYVGPNWSTDGTDIYQMFNNCGTDHVTLKQS